MRVTVKVAARELKCVGRGCRCFIRKGETYVETRGAAALCIDCRPPRSVKCDHGVCLEEQCNACNP